MFFSLSLEFRRDMTDYSEHSWVFFQVCHVILIQDKTRSENCVNIDIIAFSNAISLPYLAEGFNNCHQEFNYCVFLKIPNERRKCFTGTNI